MATTHNEGDVTFCSHSPLKDSLFHWTTTSYRQMVSDDQLQPQNIIHSDKHISFLNPPPPSSHASILIMDAPCPAPEVQGTLLEQLAVAGWEEVGGEEDK